MGPLTSLAHRDRVLAYCEVAREEGGEILLGGKAPDDARAGEGLLREPTVVRARPDAIASARKRSSGPSSP